jgi:hypothetical protein
VGWFNRKNQRVPEHAVIVHYNLSDDQRRIDL